MRADAIVRRGKRLVRTTAPTRANLSSARTGVERRVLARRHRPERCRSRILAYHAVGTWQWFVNDVPPRLFERQLDLALEEGFRFVPAAQLAAEPGPGAAELAAEPAAGPATDDRRLAVTFDDGLRSVATEAAPILADRGIPWSIFVVTDWADGRHPTTPELFLDWDELGALAAQGVSIGSHSVTHPDFGQLDGARAAAELSESRTILASRLGSDIPEFAIPFGQSANWTAAAGRAASAAGYKTVYAQSERLRPPGTVGRTFISKHDSDRVFLAALGGAFDAWEEWA